MGSREGTTINQLTNNMGEITAKFQLNSKQRTAHIIKNDDNLHQLSLSALFSHYHRHPNVHVWLSVTDTQDHSY